MGADNQAVPAVVQSNGCSPVEILNNGMTLGADGTFQMQFNWQIGRGVGRTATGFFCGSLAYPSCNNVSA